MLDTVYSCMKICNVRLEHILMAFEDYSGGCCSFSLEKQEPTWPRLLRHPIHPLLLRDQDDLIRLESIGLVGEDVRGHFEVFSVCIVQFWSLIPVDVLNFVGRKLYVVF